MGVPEDDRLVGRYRVIQRLGAGAMSVVYRAYDPDLDRDIALKLMKPWKADGAFAQVQREARAMAKLSHPNVAPVYEVGESRGRCFISMELVDGPTLADWIEETPRPWSEIVGVFLQAGRGLAAAHRAGLVHRDFKPSNALLGSDRRVRVVDFGLAIEHAIPAEVALDDSDSDGLLLDDSFHPELDAPGITGDGLISGTPAYMAPEQHVGDPATAHSDQFAFAVSMWETLFRQRPFQGRTSFAIARAIEEGRVVDPPRGSRTPGWVIHILRKGMQPDPAARYETLESMLAAIVFTGRVLHT